MYKQLCTQSCSTQSKTVRVHKEKQYMYTRCSTRTVHNTPPPPPPSAVRSVWGVGEWGNTQRRTFWEGKNANIVANRDATYSSPNIPPQGRFERIASNRSSTCSRLASPRLICICITPFNGSSQCEFSDQVRSSQCEFSDQV